MDPLFAALPESLSALTDDQLQELVDSYTSRFAAIKANDPETLGDRTAAQILEEAKQAKEQYAALKAEQAARVEAEQTYTAEIESLTADIEELAAETDGEGDDSGDGDNGSDEGGDEGASEALAAETEVESEETDTVVASVRRPLPRPKRHAPVVVEQEEDRRAVPIVASAGLPGFASGQPLSERQIGEALVRAMDNTFASHATEKVVVASARWADKIPEERRLTSDIGRNTEKMMLANRAVEREAAALVAAASPGQGNCAPLTPYYQLQDISTQDRPVRDALTGFTADRGGITYMPPPALSSITTAVGVVTEADQAAGGTFATKSCQEILCDDIVSVQVDQIFKCLLFGNLQSRAYPELVAHSNNLAMAAHARLAESLLLDEIKAGSTHVTGDDTATQGTVNNYLGDLIQAAAGIRSANRMAADSPMQAIAPLWVRDEIVLDMIRGQFDRFEYAAGMIDAFLARYNIRVAWTLDGSSDGGQVFDVQTAGALITFPTTVETALFPPGTWLYLDAGTLDLGIVRDSTLNASNQYQLFAETFEFAAKVGVVSYWLTSTLCPSGQVSAPGTAPTC